MKLQTLSSLKLDENFKLLEWITTDRLNLIEVANNWCLNMKIGNKLLVHSRKVT